MKKSELLLPVGNMNMCIAAIHGGADAIYVGMPGFNARGRTVDHTIEQLKDIIELCHLYGVKVHVAFNILIFEDEIEAAILQLKSVAKLSPDAFIVQDLGLATIIRKIFPNQTIHASTQMTITNSDAIALLDDLNIDRFVLGRENSILEIKEIRKTTEKELEVFVHGALCVAYSGQCFTSESIGGRSANRGQCAQSCRFSYDLYVDGKKEQLIEQDYLVSPQDLCGINEVNELQEIGVESFKVEGRLKSPSYVGVAAQSYKKTLEQNFVDQNDVTRMSLTYSRGFYSGWLHGVEHQKLVTAQYQSHRGILLGRVEKIDRDSIYLRTETQLKPGMGIGIYNDKSKFESGSPIFKVLNKNNLIQINLSNGFNYKKVSNGDLVYLNSSPEINKEIESITKDVDKQRKVPISIYLEAIVGKEISLRFIDNNGNSVIEKGPILEKANNSVNNEKIRKDATAIGRTIYSLETYTFDFGGTQPFVPNKILKNMKQSCIEKLNKQRVSRQQTATEEFIFSNKNNSKSDKTLNILLRNLKQVQDISSSSKIFQYKTKVRIILDFEFGKDYKTALEIIRNLNNVEVGIATTRILKPKEYHHLNLIYRLAPDFILARNLGAFHYLKKKDPNLKILGDFSLNVANSQTANYLLDKGFESLLSSYDLNYSQLIKLLDRTDASKIEVTIHQYMPSFHMEHCVFAAFLSEGSSFKDCGKPCEEHQVELEDQFGNRHFIKADQECRNTMFNATAQSAPQIAIESTTDNLKVGISTFRLELLNETEEELLLKVNTYLRLLDGLIDYSQLIDILKVEEKYGLGSGQLFKNDNYQDRKKELQ